MKNKRFYTLLCTISVLLLFWSAGYENADMIYDDFSELLYALGFFGILLSVRGIHRINFLSARRMTPRAVPVPVRSVDLRRSKSA